MGNLKHCEIESKFDATHITWEEFESFINEALPYFAVQKKPLLLKHKQVFYGCDDYYTLAHSVVRHRWGGSTNQLTVKLRKSKKSILNRVETDLNMSRKTSVNTVSEFLKNSGYSKAFCLKKKAVILWLEDKEGISYTIALYEVFPVNKPKDKKRFLEIEVEKTNDISEDKAMTCLAGVSTTFTKSFKLKKPLQKSLYEIFSKKQYRVRK